MGNRTGHAAYHWRHGVRYVAWFCQAEDIERFFDNGEDYETLSAIGTEPEPGVTCQDEGHLYCWADDCPDMVAVRDAAFEAHAAESLEIANATFDAVVQSWPKE